MELGIPIVPLLILILKTTDLYPHELSLKLVSRQLNVPRGTSTCFTKTK